MSMNEAAIHVAGLQKHYAALRPLRIQSLVVAAGERVALGGLDGAAAEVLVNLVTGAALPDAGTVAVFGRSTADIADGDAWLASLDRFGIVSPRAVMLEGSTLLQNLALPFTLEIDPVPPGVLDRVQALANECGIESGALALRAGEAAHHVRVRAHLARALALEPAVLLLEHPTADVPPAEVEPLARDLARVLDARRASALIVTLDAAFGEVVAHRSLLLEPATGALAPWKKKRGWFR
jgi:ABC-type transporter Mla maintaining outer membrane lipid asymmetry ATPase subunit MlaF